MQNFPDSQHSIFLFASTENEILYNFSEMGEDVLLEMAKSTMP